MATQTVLNITDEQKRQYREDGFFVLERVVPEEDLEMLRNLCDRLVRDQEGEMDRLGVDQINLSKRNKRYFVFLAYKDHPELGRFIFSDLMEEICRATIGDDAMLFWEQFVVKGTRSEEHTSELQSRENLVCRLLL